MCTCAYLKATEYLYDRCFYLKSDISVDKYCAHAKVYDDTNKKYRLYLAKSMLELESFFDNDADILHINRYEITKFKHNIPDTDLFCLHCHKIFLSKENLKDIFHLFQYNNINVILKFFEKIGFENKNV